MTRSDATKILETIAAERCPCGHLKQRHRAGQGDGHPRAGFREVMGACRDCGCKGLLHGAEVEK